MRLAVVSPFLDRLHGTERCIVEQLERLATRNDMEIHVYSQRIEDLNGVARYLAPLSSSRILWHKVPAIPGPHLLAYLWWFIANHLLRFWDSRIRGIKFDLLYSPGINALDADVIAVHIVFHEFYKQVRAHLRFRKASPAGWPKLLHRLVYYRLIMALERLVYPRPAVSLSSVSVPADGRCHHSQQCGYRALFALPAYGTACLGSRPISPFVLGLCPSTYGERFEKKGT